MFAARTPSSHPAFGLDPAAATRKAMALWSDNFRTASEFGLWWTEKWLRTPTYFAAWAITRTVGATPTAADTPAAANVIRIADVIEAATAAAVAPVEVAATVLEAVQTETVGALAETVPHALDTVVDAAETAVDASQQVVQSVAKTVLAEDDDLTRLVGIGPKLAAALAERGVTRYAQIAAWTQDELSEIDHALDLKGRAARDAWIAQAKRFAADI